MFTLISKIVKRLTRFPRTILAIAAILAVLSMHFITGLQWDLQLQDSLSSRNGLKSDMKIMEESFGGLGSLTIVVEGSDSTSNYETAKELVRRLQGDSLVHFAEYRVNSEFYRKNSLFYMDESDLDSVIARVSHIKEKILKENNPFLVSLSDDELPSAKDSTEGSMFMDLQKKYADILNKSHANSDGTVRIIDIYPTHPLSDLQASRDLKSKVNAILDSISEKKHFEYYFTGKVYDTIRDGKTLLPEAKTAGMLTAIFILFLFIINFHRQPQLIFISGIACLLPIVYTLGLAGFIYGRINLFTLLLALILPGQACQVISHVLKRYFIERGRKLSPGLCIESAVLGIGPSTCAYSFIMASLFASLSLVPMAGIRELSLLGCVGAILNWLVGILVTTALLKAFQKRHPFDVTPFPMQKHRFMMLPYRTNLILIAIVSVASIVCLIYGGSNLKFFYDFEKTEIQRPQTHADTLISQTLFPKFDPIIIQLPNEEAGENLRENYTTLKRRGEIKYIENIFTLSMLKNKHNRTRIEKIDSLKHILQKTSFAQMDSTELREFSFIRECLFRSNIENEEFPDEIRNRFSDKEGNSGIFAFLFHSIDANDGLMCRRLKKEIEKIEGIDEGVYRIAGLPIMRADVLDLILKNLDKSLFMGSVLLCFLLLLYYNRLSRSIFTLLPSLFAMSWLLIAIKFFNVELSVYSSLAFPIIIGTSVDGSIQLWSAFYNKQEGTALTVLKKKFSGIAISQIASLSGAFGLIMSSHPGLRSMGFVLLMGLIAIMLSQMSIFPLIANSLDNYRIWKKRK